jgi:hypothetical protein
MSEAWILKKRTVVHFMVLLKNLPWEGFSSAVNSARFVKLSRKHKAVSCFAISVHANGDIKQKKCQLLK